MKRFLFCLCLLAPVFTLPDAQAAQFVIINGVNANADTNEHLVSSFPADGETLSAPPAAVTMTFSKAVRADHSFIRVYDMYDSQLNDGTVSIVGTSMQVALPELAPGRYHIKWQGVCACPSEETLSDTYHFTIK